MGKSKIASEMNVWTPQGEGIEVARRFGESRDLGKRWENMKGFVEILAFGIVSTLLDASGQSCEPLFKDRFKFITRRTPALLCHV
jgi:hypothetical protein